MTNSRMRNLEELIVTADPAIKLLRQWIRRETERAQMKLLSNHMVKPLLVLIILALGVAACRSVLTFPHAQAQTPATPTVRDNEELVRMFQEDQADRTPSNAKDIDWAVIGPRDKARLSRVKAIYMQNGLHTGADYYHAAMILQHGDVPEDFLLAHEFCVAAIVKGRNDKETRWLAAASEDRFLMNIGRPQRFATQYRADSGTSPFRLYKVDETVTDELRRALDAPSLAKAKAKEAEINRK